MIKLALGSLQINTEAVIQNVSAIVLGTMQAEENLNCAEQIRYEIGKIEKKKEKVLDSYFSGEISREDMHTMKLKYESQLRSAYEKLNMIAEKKDTSVGVTKLKEQLQEELRALLMCETESDSLYKCLLNNITVFGDRHLELRLNALPHVFGFIG